ncbi:MAG: hypothetical protein ACREDJ_02265 [Methylocella sp.]
MVLRDDGLSFEESARFLFAGGDPIRSWFCVYEDDGIGGLAWFGHEGSACQLGGARNKRS